MKESYEKFMKYSIWLLFIIFGFRCYIAKSDIGIYLKVNAWGELCYNVFGYAGEAIGITTVLMSLFNTVIWKWKWVSKIVDMPVLAKKYTGTFVSDWQGENKKYDGSLDIKQSFLNVSIAFKTGESRSFSVLSSIETEGDWKKIVYIYQNEPKAELADRSSIHKGTAELWIEESGELTGNYYTSRNTRGSMNFKPITSKSSGSNSEQE